MENFEKISTGGGVDVEKEPSGKEIIIEKTEEDLLDRGKKIDKTASAIENLRNPANKEDFKDFYYIMVGRRETDLREKKEDLVRDIAAFIKEKTLRKLGKGRKIDAKTFLILNKKISDIAKIAMEKKYFTLIIPPGIPSGLKCDIRAQAELSIAELEKKARREAMDWVIRKKLSPDEEKNYPALHDEFLEEFNTKVEEERRKREGVE